MPLHLTRIAFGCNELEHLRARLASRTVDHQTSISTRYRPTRHVELIGGSLFWIIKHQIIARSRIVGFAEDEGRCTIQLDAAVVPVRVRPKRAHQGWRYLAAEDAPLDLDGEADDLAALPPRLIGELVALALI